MGEILQPESMATYLRDLERRITLLESSGRPSQVPMDVTKWEDEQGTFSATFVPLFDLRIDVATGTAALVRLTAFTDPGTMGEWRIIAPSITGTPTSPVVPVSSTPQSALSVYFVDGLSYGDRAVRLRIEARVTSGGGGVYLDWPTEAWIGTSIVTGA